MFDTWPLSAQSDGELDRVLEFQRKLGGPGVNRRLDQAADETIVRVGDIHNEYVASVKSDFRCHRLDTRTGQVVHDTYAMPDHGLFIADILKDIAPNARLMVYRVLDDYGVGDMHTIGRAIQHALTRDRSPDKPLILNLSLGCAPQLLLVRDSLRRPREFAENRDNYVARRLAALPANAVRNADRELRILEGQGLVKKPDGGCAEPVHFLGPLQALEVMFGFQVEGVNPSQVLPVAAAGNDSAFPVRLYGPRMPAAIEGVLGVSSVRDTQGATASYTNADDLRCPDDGISAFGGDLGDGVPPPTANGEDRLPPGMVGLFVSDNVPEDEPPTNNVGNDYNLNGWAMWDGTSFAAPVVSALAACIWSERPDMTAEDVLKRIVEFQGGGERPYIDLRQQHLPYPVP